MDALIEQAQHLASSSDEAGRKKLIDAFRNLSYALESPDDTLQRIMYYVSLFYYTTLLDIAEDHHSTCRFPWSVSALT